MITAPLLTALAAAALAIGAMPCAAQQNDPKPPAGQDPGGFPVAIVSAGIDYMDAAVASRLARDGEGEVIGYDVADNDARAYAPPGTEGSGTELAKRLAAVSGIRLIPVRAAVGDPVSIARAAAFAMQTPARVIVTPAGDKSLLDLLGKLAQRADKILFIVSPRASSPAEAPPPLPDNVLDLTALPDRPRDAQPSNEAVAITLDRLLGCAGKAPDGTGADMKKALLAVSAAEPNPGPALKPCSAR